MYFEKCGKANTETTVKLAIETAYQRKIKNIVVASGSGVTADKFKNLKDINVVCVGHPYGYPKPGENELSDKERQNLIDSGIKVLTAAPLLSAASGSFDNTFLKICPTGIVADTLRMFSQGVKVCVEISVMALDAGIIPYGEKVIAVAGTGIGADTALIIIPEYSNKMLNTKINEIICKPV